MVIIIIIIDFFQLLSLEILVQLSSTHRFSCCYICFIVQRKKNQYFYLKYKMTYVISKTQNTIRECLYIIIEYQWIRQNVNLLTLLEELNFKQENIFRQKIILYVLSKAASATMCFTNKRPGHINVHSCVYTDVKTRVFFL